MDLIAQRIIEFTTQNINLYLLMLIVFSGIFITKYTQDLWKIKDAYKVLFASIVFSVVFYFIDECTENCAPKYLFTYLFATSLYELIMKFVLSAANKTFKTKTTITVEKQSSDIGGDMPDPDKEEK